MTEREKQILDLLRSNPLISQKELATKLGIQRSSVAVHITNLTKKGYIQGKGYILNEEDYVVVVGGSNIDITGFTKKPLVKEDSNPGSIRISSGGVGRNIAASIAMLGVKTRLVSAVGDDLFGRRIIEDCQRAGVDTSLVKVDNAIPSSIYLSILNHLGDMEVAVSDMDIANRIDIETLQQLHTLFMNAAVIVVDTNLPNDSIRYLTERYQGKLFLDTVSTAKTRKVADLFQAFSFIKPNRKEAEILIGQPIETLKEAREAVAVFLERGVEKVVVSMGQQGVVYGNREGIDHFRLEEVSSVNATGAGDAFMAAMVYGHLRRMDLHEMVRLASAASYLTLQNENTLNPELSIENLKKVRMELNI